MVNLENRLELFKRNKRCINFEELVYEIKTGNLIEEETRYNQREKNIKLQIDNVLEEIKVNTEIIKGSYELSLRHLGESIFVNIDTYKLGYLYEYSSKMYFELFDKIIDYFISLYDKIDILINHYGEKNIYFNKKIELLEDFAFYENYVLQIELLIKLIMTDKYLLEKDKALLLEKIIPIEIFNIDYLLSINKLFKTGEFVSYSIDNNLREIYVQRFQELSELYQQFLNLKIVKFPTAKNVVDMKIRQINIKNKYKVETNEYVIPEL